MSELDQALAEQAREAREPTTLGARVRRFAAGLSLLTLASGAHKAAMFVMKARLGQLGGTELLGAVTAVLTTTWIVTALCHLGLPDLAMVRSALETTERTRAQARHGLYLGTVLVAAAIALALGLGARPDTPALVVLLVLGAIAQHAAAVTLATLRGLAQPRLEAATLAVAASCLVGVSLVADGPLGVAAGYALQGLVFLVAIGVGTRLVPALVPAVPAPSALVGEIRGSFPIFVIGVCALCLESTDVLVSQRLLGDGAVGELGCASMLVRTALVVPWLAGSLLLGRLREGTLTPARLVGALAIGACVLGLGAGLVAYLTRELVPLAMGVPLARFEGALVRAALLGPLPMLATLALPVAMALATREAVGAALAGLVVTVACTFALGHAWGLAGVQIGSAIGNGALALGLVVAIVRAETIRGRSHARSAP